MLIEGYNVSSMFLYQELKATAQALQEAINKLQHEYKRLSQVTIVEDEQDPNKLSTSEQKLVRLCSRNRRCLSRVRHASSFFLRIPIDALILIV